MKLSRESGRPAYLNYMVRLLTQDGVRFPNNKEMRFSQRAWWIQIGPPGKGV